MSYQMIGDANLNKYLGMENRQDINTLPRELEEKAPSQEILYQTIANSHEVKYYNDASKLTDAEKGCYNVVVLGPTGCGKSTIVNQIFNKSVCPTGANAFSVTREIRFYHGRCERLKKMINIIDTVGEILAILFLLLSGDKSFFLYQMESTWLRVISLQCLTVARTAISTSPATPRTARSSR